MELLFRVRFHIFRCSGDDGWNVVNFKVGESLLFLRNFSSLQSVASVAVGSFYYRVWIFKMMDLEGANLLLVGSYCIGLFPEF